MEDVKRGTQNEWGVYSLKELESVLSNRGLGTRAKKGLYDGVIVPTAFYRAEAWGLRSAERGKVNVLEKESECSWDEVFEKFGWSVANG